MLSSEGIEFTEHYLGDGYLSFVSDLVNIDQNNDFWSAYAAYKAELDKHFSTWKSL